MVRLGPTVRPATRCGRAAAWFLVTCAAFGCGGPGNEAAAGPAVTSVSIERGQYLTEGLLQCFICHSERDWESPGAPPVEGRVGAGWILSEDGAYRLVAPNLTPDPKTGIGQWSDGQLGRAIREGIGHDGRVLSPRMWYKTFRHLSDSDLAAVIAYLRSREPVSNPLPATFLPPDWQAELNARAPRPLKPLDVEAPDLLERGRALVALGDCEGCHTAWGAPGYGLLLAGGNHISRGEFQAFSTNITPHPSGMAYDAETFIGVMRTGKQGALHPLMPWIAFRNLSDADLRAMHAYLQTMPPVAHYVNNHVEPTYCAVCGEVHGLGELNPADGPEGVRIDPSAFDRYAGTYYSEEEDFELRIYAEGDRLLASVDGEGPVEPRFQSDTRFFLPGEPAQFEFAFSAGRAVHVRTMETDPIVLERVEGA